MAERTIVVAARSEAEAVLQAAQRFGVKPEELHADLLRPGRQGFWGLGRRLALFRVRATPSAVDPAAVHNIPSDAGEEPSTRADPEQTMVEVSQGRIRVHPGSPAKPAYIRVAGGIRILVDGKPAGELVAVTGTETLQLELPSSEDLPAAPDAAHPFDIWIRPDRMQAFLRLYPRLVLRVEDVPPARIVHLKPRTAYQLPEGLTAAALAEALARRGVRHGINFAAIADALGHPHPEPVLVAEGTPPQAGRDGWVERLVETEPAAVCVIDESGRADFRERPDIPFYPPGTPILRIHLPREGTPGRDVTGKEIPPAKPRKVSITIGRGVRAEQQRDGTTLLVTTRGGRPVLRETGPFHYYATVHEVYRHPRDVDMASGNLRYHGDVWIDGQVTDGMSVTAGGDVIVVGLVAGGQVAADGNIEARDGVVRGRLVAGYRAVLARRLQPVLPAFAKRLEALQLAVYQLQGAAAERLEETPEPARLAELLLARQFADIPRSARQLRQALAEFAPHLRADRQLEALYATLGRITTHRATCEDLAALVYAVADATVFLEAHQAVVGDIDLTYAHHATVTASGRIRVLHQGAYFSNFSAGREFRSYGPIIGGRVEAERSIVVAEAGSVAEAVTWLCVKGEGSIHVRRGHANVILKIGEAKRRLKAVTGPFTAKLVGRRIHFVAGH